MYNQYWIILFISIQLKLYIIYTQHLLLLLFYNFYTFLPYLPFPFQEKRKFVSFFFNIPFFLFSSPLLRLFPFISPFPFSFPHKKHVLKHMNSIFFFFANHVCLNVFIRTENRVGDGGYFELFSNVMQSLKITYPPYYSFLLLS